MKNKEDENVIFVNYWEEAKLSANNKKDYSFLEEIDIWVSANDRKIAEFFERYRNKKEKSQAKLTLYVNEDKK